MRRLRQGLEGRAGVTDLATLTPTRLQFDQEVEEQRGDLDADYSGWFCVRTDPWPCPAVGCGAVLDFMTAAHLVVVWPGKDDRSLLSFANDAATFGRNPRITEYRSEFGACIAYDEWRRIGSPVHGVLDRPEGIPFRAL